MAGEIPNPVRYDPRLDVFCCEQRRFGLRYDKRFVSIYYRNILFIGDTGF
jgi:hypothetical protein